MHVLVTGGSGFIGTHLVSKLLSLNVEVTLLVRNNTNSLQLRERFPSVHFLVYEPGCFEEEGDFDSIIHLAALYLNKAYQNDIRPLIESNITLSVELFNFAVESEVKTVVCAGTGWQNLGKGKSGVNLYSVTKSSMSNFARYFADNSKTKFVTLLISDTYGPNDTRNKLIPSLLDSYSRQEVLKMSPGYQIIDLTHVYDVCQGFISVLTNPHKYDSGDYLITGGSRISLRELVNTLNTYLGGLLHVDFGSLPYRDGEVMEPFYGENFLKDWVPSVSLDSGLSEIVNSFKSKLVK